MKYIKKKITNCNINLRMYRQASTFSIF